MHSFAKKFANYLHKTQQKKFAHFCFFLIAHQIIKRFAKFFAYLKWHGHGFLKMYILSILNIFVCKLFYYITGFCNKKFNFCKFVFFLQILKVEHKSFLMMYHLSYLDMGFRGQITPPPSVFWFSSTPAGIGLRINIIKNLYLKHRY